MALRFAQVRFALQKFAPPNIRSGQGRAAEVRLAKVRAIEILPRPGVQVISLPIDSRAQVRLAEVR
jgi:hypothetical protein